MRLFWENTTHIGEFLRPSFFDPLATAALWLAAKKKSSFALLRSGIFIIWFCSCCVIPWFFLFQGVPGDFLMHFFHDDSKGTFGQSYTKSSVMSTPCNTDSKQRPIRTPISRGHPTSNILTYVTYFYIFLYTRHTYYWSILQNDKQ